MMHTVLPSTCNVAQMSRNRSSAVILPIMESLMIKRTGSMSRPT